VSPEAIASPLSATDIQQVHALARHNNEAGRGPEAKWGISLTEEISATTPGGKLVFHIFAVLVELEGGLVIE
jgi:hypothetical protein